MVSALVLPRVLDQLQDRKIMIPAAGLLALLLLAFGLAAASIQAGPLWVALLVIWVSMGLCYSAVMTPTGRLLRRSAQADDRPAVFAAQFALSHGAWLVTYPIAGWFGSLFGMTATALVLAAIASLGAWSAARLWPVADPDILAHTHPELPERHPHFATAAGGRHVHAFVIDDIHRRWPSDT